MWLSYVSQQEITTKSYLPYEEVKCVRGGGGRPKGGVGKF